MRTHCDDSSLLAYSDRELGFWKSAQVRSHLGYCWQCRARLMELECQALSIAQALTLTFPKLRIEAAKSRFFDGLADRNITFQTSGEERRASPSVLKLCGLSLLACASAFALWRAAQPLLNFPAPHAVEKANRLAPRTPALPEPIAVSASRPAVIAPAPAKHEPATVPADIAVDSDALEVNLLFALHQAGSCLGEQVEVSREISGEFLIHGIVESPQRRQEILDHLALAAGAQFVRTSLLTVEESVQMSAIPEDSREFERPAPESRSVHAGSDEVLLFLKSQNDHATGAELQRRISDVSNSAVNGANSALADAWAVRRLRERFPLSKMSRLSSESRSLVKSMLQDHLRGLQTGISGINRLIGSGGFSGPEPMDSDDWTSLASRIFDSTSEVHGSVLRLFASAAPGGSGSPDSLPKLRADLNDLLDLIARCSSQLRGTI